MERNVIDVSRVVSDAAKGHDFGPCKFAHDQSRILVVVNADPGALPRHLAICEIEKNTGLAVTVRTWSELSPGERSKLESIGVLVH